MKLPFIITKLQDLALVQSKWAAILNAFLSNPSNQSTILTDVPLINGTTVVNHRLGQRLQGWRVARINAAATLYDAQSTNKTPDLTLVLVSNAACTVTLEVY